MILSIVMMVKNEESILERTLNSLKPLMNDIDTELVILDTGSTDGTLNIAKKFTDKVYTKDWNNNFGEMRNESLKYAKGEWVLVLDADEELLDYSRLIDFLNGDDCKIYNSGSIELLNLSSIEDNTKYNIGQIVRFFRNTKKLKYTGAVHEQPEYKLPIYNNIMTFKHYGYLFEDEELRQRKHIRNLELLKESLKKNPGDAYIFYQLSKQYLVDDKLNDAYENMEKSYRIHSKEGYIPEYVYEGLAHVYILKGKNSECEKLCLKYIKKDDKNIDIYYYLAKSQMNKADYDKSIQYYKRYLWLLDNYEITTQYNSILSSCLSAQSRDTAIINMIKMYYMNNKFEDVIEYFDYIEDEKNYRLVYLELFEALFNKHKFEGILKYYEKVKESDYESEQFRINLEKLIIKSKEKDRRFIFEVCSKIEGNYGKLNKLRLEEKYTKEYKNILAEEDAAYYGDILYYALLNNENIEEILIKLECTSIDGYINYLISHKKSVILSLYTYLDKSRNTIDLNKLKVYCTISKQLLFNTNLNGAKYENILRMYTSYQYDYIKRAYKTDLSDKEILTLLCDEKIKLVIKLKSLEKIKYQDKVEYIKSLNRLLKEYPLYKKIIKTLIKNFKDIQEETEATRILKNNLKQEIKNNVEIGRIDIANAMIQEYENIFDTDSETLSIKAVISIMSGDLNNADSILKQAHLMDILNKDILFNIGYIRELQGNIKDAKMYYSYILELSDESDINIINCVNEQMKNFSI